MHSELYGVEQAYHIISVSTYIRTSIFWATKKVAYLLHAEHQNQKYAQKYNINNILICIITKNLKHWHDKYGYVIIK